MKTMNNHLKQSKYLLAFPLLLMLFLAGCKDDGDGVTPTTVASLISEGKTVQEIIDAGFTPKQVYDFDNTYLDSLYGISYEGGLIFYMNTTDGTGLVAASSDDRSHFKWGCYGTTISGADDASIGAGKQNTADIEAGCTTIGTAADFCANVTMSGKSDWFLPSINELKAMNTNLKLLGYGHFGSVYWSSTERNSAAAWGFNFNSNSQQNYTKVSQLYVRAIREF